ncbi:hypothetical protein Peur_024252 [Populus x canadensis]
MSLKVYKDDICLVKLHGKLYLEHIDFGLANAATTEKIGNDNYRHYDSDIATGLGVSALLFLMASQLLIVVGWVFFFIAEVCLLAASARNAYHTKYLSVPSHSCQKVRKGVFWAGAALVVLTSVVSELYYVSYSKANDGQLSYNGDTGTRTGNL